MKDPKVLAIIPEISAILSDVSPTLLDKFGRVADIVAESVADSCKSVGNTAGNEPLIPKGGDNTMTSFSFRPKTLHNPTAGVVFGLHHA